MKWTRSLPDYPAGDGWTLTYYFAGASVLTVAATADGDDYLVTVSATSSATLAAGTYEYLARVSLDGEVFPAGSGSVVVTPDLATADPNDRRAHAERMVPLLEAEIAARVSGDGTAHKSYTVAGRAIEKFTLDELQKLLGIYRAQVAAAQYNGRLPSRLVTFHAAG